VKKSRRSKKEGTNGLSGLDDSHSESRLESESDSVVDISLPLRSIDSSGLGVVEGVASSVWREEEEGNESAITPLRPSRYR